MNVICFAGNISQDAEIKQVGDQSVANFSVAENQGRDKPTIFWRCQLWGKRAESLAQYLAKGQKVTISGTIQFREYTNKEGIKQSIYDIRVNDVALQGDSQRQELPQARQSQQNQRPAPVRQAPNFSDMDDDIPFN